MPDLLNGEDVAGQAVTVASGGRFSPYQWAWLYVIGSMVLLWLLGFFVFRGRG